MLQSANNQPPHQAGVAKTHFGLGGMDIDVHETGIAVQEQRQRRMAVARQEIGIGAAHRPHQQLVAHRAAIDEQELHRGIGAIVGGQPGIAREADAFAHRFHPRGIVAEIAAHDLGQARQPSVHQVGLAGKSSALRPSKLKVKPISGRAIASRLTMSVIAKSSDRVDLRNFSRAGVA